MKILHLEDSSADAELIRESLGEEWPACEVDVVDSRADFLRRLERSAYDVILSDFSLHAFSGLEAMKLAHERTPEVPFIFVSGTIREDVAIEAVRDGAADYVLKDRPLRLITAIKHALAKRDEVRKRLEAEVRIREQKELLDRARDAIMVSDLNGRILYWNEGATKLLGWTADEMIGQPIDPLVDPATLASFLEIREKTAQEEEWSGELRMKTKAGRVAALETRVSLVRDVKGQPKAWMSISTDVTERNRFKEQFFRAQRLESLGMLAAGIAHDLNNVLAPMLMAPALLRQRTRDPRDEQVLHLLERSVERGTALVRQILSFAHGAHGEFTVIQARHILRELGDFITQTFPKNVRFEVSVAPDLWPIRASPTQVHQVLLNLCINARDAMPEGGRLRLTAENVRLDETTAQTVAHARPGAWVVVHVEDTGCGIPPEIVHRIWDPFFTTKGEDKGTGLGLSTVRGLVENHGGFIQLDTAPGRGTRFSVYLPAADAPASVVEKLRLEDVERGKGQAILVVGDDAAVTTATVAILNAHGYRAESAHDGVEALASFAKRRDYALVITDVDLPDLKGETLAGIFRKISPRIKILAVSGAAANRAAAAHGFADAFLPRPFGSEVLLMQVAAMLRN